MRRHRSLGWYAIGMGLLAACGSPPPISTPSPSAHTVFEPAPLMVGIVIDQFGSQTLNRYLPYLDGRGLIKRMISRGAYFEHTHLPYAATFTAPGHAAIYTGRLPRDNGIAANRVWNPGLGRWLSVVDDRTHAVFGAPDQFAGPMAMRAPTLGDLLKQSTKGHARVVSLSLKPWPAIVSAGKSPDMVAWYHAGDGQGRMTTSSYYGKVLPAWLTSWSTAHPVQKYLTVWSARDPALLRRVLGEDIKPGESLVHGWSASMPHDPLASPSPAEAFLFTPPSVQYLLDAALAAVEHYRMGTDHVSDLLMLSVSTTDIVGHAFGNASWEYLDVLVRTDRMLGDFIDNLSQRIQLAVLVTSDHGVGPMPEQSQSLSAERLTSDELLTELRRAAYAGMGPGAWIDSCDGPFVAFGKDAEAPPARRVLVQALQKGLASDPRIFGLYDLWSLKDLPTPPVDLWGTAVWKSAPPNPVADLYVLSNRDVVLRQGLGTTHGTPWEYDSEVPTLIYAPGIKSRRQSSAVEMTQLAPTIAKLLGIAPPVRGVRSLLP
ncbi:MAG: alkaline phosphatase family protein [Myxococcales bacterium]|nr:alkaline phosphatase family protein [Myxococcales bacterium]MCB9708170.1 alkaline phosphatase family protein [Myxococcales bacterium]